MALSFSVVRSNSVLSCPVVWLQVLRPRPSVVPVLIGVLWRWGSLVTDVPPPPVSGGSGMPDPQSPLGELN